MKTILSTLSILLAIPFSSFSQVQLNLDTNFQTHWESIEIKNDSVAKRLASSNPKLKFQYSNFPEYLHIINLNNDLYPDAIFYWPDNSNEPIYEIYINKEGILELKLEKRGTITGMEVDTSNNSIRFTLNEFGYSSPPFLNRLHFVNIMIGDNDIQSQTIIYFGETEIPPDFNIHRRFLVTQAKYRLRKTPKIEDDNIICELAAGDTGTAIASKTDETGRVWWFVVADNNITKSTNDYFYIDADSPEGFNSLMLGWMSSRFVKDID